MTRVLVVEDNKDLAAGLVANLELEGYEVFQCGDGALALAVVAEVAPDLIVLDMMLPNTDGFSILSELREQGRRLPILCLTARAEEMDKVRALRSGADDYLTKPFGLMELLARVEALLRRSGNVRETLTIGGIEIDLGCRQVSKNGSPVPLAPREFDLLAALASCPNRVFTRLQLMQLAWGHRGAVISRTVDTHIAELRRKLEDDPANPVLILTVRKAGYRVRAD